MLCKGIKTPICLIVSEWSHINVVSDKNVFMRAVLTDIVTVKEQLHWIKTIKLNAVYFWPVVTLVLSPGVEFISLVTE